MSRIHAPDQVTEHTMPGAVRAAVNPAASAFTAIQAVFRGHVNAEVTNTLQQTVGNRATGRTIQAKLRVGDVGDRFEHEADRMADALTGSGPSSQHDPTGQMPPRGVSPTEISAPVVTTPAGGEPLDEATRLRMEGGLGHDLGRVRVHADLAADRAARSIGALAFTTGQDVFFRAGQYQPGTRAGQRLLAHELSHVVQQAGGARSAAHGPQGRLSPAPRSAQRVPTFVETLKRKIRGGGMIDEDVVEHASGSGGTANRVDPITYKSEIAKTRHGFFKPDDPEDLAGSARAVASSRLDRALGLNILAKEKFATHTNPETRILEEGSVSAAVKGRPLHKEHFTRELTPDKAAQQPPTKKRFDQATGQWYGHSGTEFLHHDFANPKTQKGMSDLQLLDAITGQRDRHGGNIYVDAKSGKVKGIDNDFAFALGEPGTNVNFVGDKTHGLPSQVDAKTAKKILRMSDSKVVQALQGKRGEHAAQKLTDEEVKNAQARFQNVKEHIRQLKKNKQLVKKWDATTYRSAVEEPEKPETLWPERTMAASYLQRSVLNYQDAASGQHEGVIAELPPGSVPATAVAPATQTPASQTAPPSPTAALSHEPQQVPFGKAPFGPNVLAQLHRQIQPQSPVVAPATPSAQRVPPTSRSSSEGSSHGSDLVNHGQAPQLNPQVLDELEQHFQRRGKQPVPG